MKLIRAALLLTLGVAPSAAVAQAASPVSDALRSLSKEMLGNLLASAQDMPADKYAFKPTPAQLSFGAMVLHVANSGAYLCSSVSGKDRPTWPRISADSVAKDTLVARLQAAVAFCDGALAVVDDSKLGDMVQFFGNQQVTKARAALVLIDDLADHYSQAAIYMRLNGLLPPTARRQGN